MPHKILAHQAVLSALIAKDLDPERIQWLSSEYRYPLHMHEQVPADRRADTLNELICPVYEDELPLGGIEVHEPLRSWLAERIQRGGAR